MSILEAGKNQIKHVATGKIVSLDSLWKNQTAVIIFFRRWGCMLCRVWAKEVSQIGPILKKHNVKLVGIGVDDTGAKEFLDGNFFDGELYTDVDNKNYRQLHFKRFNYISILTSLLWSESRDVISKGLDMKVGGDIRGDGLQNGGAFVVDKYGKVLLSFKQDNGPAEHVSNEKFLEVLNLSKEINNLKNKPTH